MFFEGSSGRMRRRMFSQMGLKFSAVSNPNPNFESPAFADLLAEQVLWQARAAWRRQAKQIQNPNFADYNLFVRAFVFWNACLFQICMLPAFTTQI